MKSVNGKIKAASVKTEQAFIKFPHMQGSFAQRCFFSPSKNKGVVISPDFGEWPSNWTIRELCMYVAGTRNSASFQVSPMLYKEQT